jgi:hypothetical protein
MALTTDFSPVGAVSHKSIVRYVVHESKCPFTTANFHFIVAAIPAATMIVIPGFVIRIMIVRPLRAGIISVIC